MDYLSLAHSLAPNTFSRQGTIDSVGPLRLMLAWLSSVIPTSQTGTCLALLSHSHWLSTLSSHGAADSDAGLYRLAPDRFSPATQHSKLKPDGLSLTHAWINRLEFLSDGNEDPFIVYSTPLYTSLAIVLPCIMCLDHSWVTS